MEYNIYGCRGMRHGGKMKNTALLLVFLLLVSALLSACAGGVNKDAETTTVPADGDETSVLWGDEPVLKFDVNGGAAVLISCEFALGEFTVPSEHEGKKVAKIAAGAFEGSIGLTKVILPDTLTEIGDRAFLGCPSLTEIVLPDSLTKIGDYAFYGCPALETVSLGAAVTDIGKNAFVYCTALRAVEVAGQNPKFESADGVLFTKGGTELILYPAGRSDESYGIDGKVSIVADFAFAYAVNLKTITMTGSVAAIGSNAFYSCPSLSDVALNGSITFIGANTFSNCTALTEITIPDGIVSIGYKDGAIELGGSFSGCTALQTINLPETLQTICAQSFEGCERLVKINFAGSMTRWQAVEIGDGNESLGTAVIAYGK